MVVVVVVQTGADYPLDFGDQHQVAHRQGGDAIPAAFVNPFQASQQQQQHRLQLQLQGHNQGGSGAMTAGRDYSVEAAAAVTPQALFNNPFSRQSQVGMQLVFSHHVFRILNSGIE